MSELPIRAPNELFSLDGRVAVVTGASSGLGARWAPVLAAAGADVVLVARRRPELEQVAATVPRATVVVADLNEDEGVATVATVVRERYGRGDVLVNNAGTAESAPALEMSTASFRGLLDADLTAVFALTQSLGKLMVEVGRGSVINIASLGADRVLDRYPLAAYSAAKAGLVALTRSLAAEWGPHGVRVNAIGPAFFPTRLSGFLEDQDQVDWIESHTALSRTARLDELDGAVLFFASDASTYVTGQHLLVDGGWSVY